MSCTGRLSVYYLFRYWVSAVCVLGEEIHTPRKCEKCTYTACKAAYILILLLAHTHIFTRGGGVLATKVGYEQEYMCLERAWSEQEYMCFLLYKVSRVKNEIFISLRELATAKDTLISVHHQL